MGSCLRLAFAAVVSQTLAVSSAHAIVIRDDVSDDAYVVPDEAFAAVVDLISRGDCAATLVHPSFLLTVAHCANELAVGASLDVNGTSHRVAQIALHPSWRDRDAFDIALVRLETAVSDVAPIPLYRDTDELGAFVTIVGRGDTATGLVGEGGAQNDGRLRRATNVVSAVNEHFLEVVFEGPEDPGVTDLEGVGAAGDSGGPVFIEVGGQRYLAGLNSYGEEGDGIDIGTYGSRDYQTRVSQFVDWIDGIIGEPPAEPTPLPTLSPLGDVPVVAPTVVPTLDPPVEEPSNERPGPTTPNPTAKDVVYAGGGCECATPRGTATSLLVFAVMPIALVLRRTAGSRRGPARRATRR